MYGGLVKSGEFDESCSRWWISVREIGRWLSIVVLKSVLYKHDSEEARGLLE